MPGPSRPAANSQSAYINVFKSRQCELDNETTDYDVVPGAYVGTCRDVQKIPRQGRRKFRGPHRACRGGTNREIARWHSQGHVKRRVAVRVGAYVDKPEKGLPRTRLTCVLVAEEFDPETRVCGAVQRTSNRL